LFARAGVINKRFVVSGAFDRSFNNAVDAGGNRGERGAESP
jgi:hypothetical protein